MEAAAIEGLKGIVYLLQARKNFKNKQTQNKYRENKDRVKYR